jgi:hypothetical protein
MSQFAANGTVSYRTKLMETAAAWRFATCLKANARFTDVAMNHSSRAKGAARYFVTYRPRNPERQAEMLTRQQVARQERAESERFEFLADKDGGRVFHWCVSVASGGVYQTTPSSCTCPDEQYRAVPGGCKHQRALRLQLDEGRAL